MSEWAAVVLAAGKGSRMRSKRPKVLHPVCGRPMVAHVVRAAQDAGIEQIVVVVAEQAADVRAALGDGVLFAQQAEPRGTADALAAARQLLEGHASHVLVLNGDVPLIRQDTLRSMMAAHIRAKAPLTLLTCSNTPAEGLGRVIRDASRAAVGVVEAAELPEKYRGVMEVNCGVYCFDARWLWPNLRDVTPSKEGELYLTSLVSFAYRMRKPAHTVTVSEPAEALGVDTRVRLAEAEAAMRLRIRSRWMLEGVTFLDPPSIYVDAEAAIGRDTVVHPNTSILGASVVGEDCEIGPGTVLRNARVGSRCRVLASFVEESTLEEDVTVGPYSHLRGNSHVGPHTHLGNFVEVNRSRLGSGMRSHHFSYLGDATVGKDVNIGAGTVTCNFDGVKKNPTVIEEGAFVGCDSMLVAPVRVGARAKTGAGAVVTRDVPADTTVVGVPARPLAGKAEEARGSSKGGKG